MQRIDDGDEIFITLIKINENFIFWNEKRYLPLYEFFYILPHCFNLRYISCPSITKKGYESGSFNHALFEVISSIEKQHCSTQQQ